MAHADEVEERLAGTDLFAGLDRKTLHRLREGGEVQQFAPGEVITAEGAPVSGWKVFSKEGVFFHLVLAGTAEVRKNEETVAVLGPGAYFGELSLIDGKPRSADVVAGPDGMTTFAVPKLRFTALLEQHPEVAVPMLQVLASRLRAADG